MKKEWAVMIDGKVFNTFDTREAAEELMLYITEKNRERKKFGFGSPWAEGKRTLVCREVSPWRKEPLGAYRVGCAHYYHTGRESQCRAVPGEKRECRGRFQCTTYTPKNGGRP